MIVHRRKKPPQQTDAGAVAGAQTKDPTNQISATPPSRGTCRTIATPITDCRSQSGNKEHKQTQQGGETYPLAAPAPPETPSTTAGGATRTGQPAATAWLTAQSASAKMQSAAKYGRRIYTVTDPSHDDPVNPKPGTLRHAAIQPDPLWIIFKSDMVIRLKQELIINSHKTIDGRGASVHIAGGACIAIHHASNIIVHGIHIHDCVKSGNAVIRDSPSHAGWWEVSDGAWPSSAGHYFWGCLPFGKREMRKR
ncbi:probable pectate lyase 8 [Phtheirospermum japonicum]|uniref:Probable pectate lyase 8 n=1 Tax=Phtheirospermum japonicum TaxID=374723 RepID=A0A830C8P5_9LAMI|nr:probable pectate lyase 8 [Phtheirospermum japonicum]